jgi:hypothetical protein
MEVDRNGLEVLSESECLTRLESGTVGRVAVTVGALPAIFPINYLLVDRTVLFRTGSGTKLTAATKNAVVAFEVDDFDPVDHTGWSVMIVGIARDVTDVVHETSIDETLIARWAHGPDGRIVAIVPEQITGRQLGHAAAQQGGTVHTRPSTSR